MSIKTRILFWGIQRSGNHAIINWILEQYREPKMWLNNQPICQELKASAKHLLSEYGDKHDFAPRLIYKYKEKKNWLELWKNNQDGGNKFLLVSFENRKFNSLSSEEYELQYQIIDNFLGKSEQTINIVLLRDPFNMWTRELPYPRRPQDPELWKIYAREYLGETNFLSNKITINFNDWFKNIEYRKSISQRLGVDFSDYGINKVDAIGGGSTFDGINYDGNAQKMNVLNRWEESNNFNYKRRLFKIIRQDREMSRLVETIYPDLYHKWNRITWKNFWYAYF